jgi:hypothetical protein
MSALSGAGSELVGDTETSFPLVCPQGWVVDDLAVERLRWQLAHAPKHVGAAVAPSGDLRSGASYRTHAHHLSLQPMAAVVETSRTAVAGAAVVRPGVGARRDDGGVDIETGTILIDHGTHAHDPERPLPSLRPASALGRSPFPWRPSVVFVALSPSQPDLIRWLGGLVNELLGHDVEARLAVAEPVADQIGGVNLTRPCLASAASLLALGPDVIAPIDDAALSAVAEWTGGDADRVLMQDRGAAGVELGASPRPLGAARWAGRFGTDVTAADLAAAVRRLCGLPRRLRPDPDEPPSALPPPVRRTRRPVAVRRTVALVSGRLDESARRRQSGFADAFRHSGEHVRILTDSNTDETAACESVDLLVVHSSATADHLEAVLEQRRASRKRSVIDLSGPTAFLEAGTETEGRLTARTDGWVETAQMAMTPSHAIASILDHRGVDHQRVPTLYGAGWGQAPPIEPLGVAGDGQARHVIGWDVGAAGAATSDALEVVADALGALLDDRADLSVEITGDPTRVPDAVFDHPQISVLPDRLVGPDALSRWLVQLWTPDHDQIELEGDLWAPVRAGRVGVPTVMDERVGKQLATAEADLLVPALATDGEWRRRIEAVADDPRLGRFLREVTMERTRTEFGPTACFRVLRRAVAWTFADPSGQHEPPGRGSP